jgi:hypothetical protein
MILDFMLSSMKVRFFLLTSAFSIGFWVGLQAQNIKTDESVRKFEIKWTAPLKIKVGENLWKEVLHFEGAVYSSEIDRLPRFSVTFPTPGHLLNQEINGTIVNALYEPLMEKHLISDQVTVLDKIIPDVQIGYSRKESYTTVQFVPLIRTQNGYEKLISFDLRLYPTGTKQQPKSSPHSWASQSVLATGKWYKIAVKEDGLYKLDYQFLKQLGFDMSILDPRQIRLFGNGIGMLPEANSAWRPDDLVENAIEVIGEADGVFHPSDYVLFYGRSPDRWTFNSSTARYSHQKHLYHDYNYYFITADYPHGTPKRIVSMPSLPPQPNDFIVTAVDHLAFHHNNLKNFIKSGRHFYGETFDINLTQKFAFNVPNLVMTEPVWYNVVVMARSIFPSTFTIRNEGQVICTALMAAISTGPYADYGTLKDCKGTFQPSGSPLVFELTYSFNPAAPSSIGYLDFIEINARRQLTVQSTAYTFRDKAAFLSNASQARYTIQGYYAGYRVWDVTDPYNVTEQQLNPDGSFIADATQLREYLLFRNQQAMTPVAKGEVPNQNLHGLASADLIIVSHPLFISQANRLAELHRQHDNMSVHVVDIDHVYNEFSSGTRDVTAIRDFLKMIYDRSNGQYPEYLLLFGDGSYDNKGEYPSNTNFIPTYQSENSLSVLGSYQSDDYFGFLDDNEGYWPPGNNSNLLDIGIGRLPAKSLAEATAMTDKIYRYVSTGLTENPTACNPANSPLGDWRNVICLIADDEDSGAYVDQSDTLMNNLNPFALRFNIDKIYLDAYPQVSTAGGQRYPEVNTAINNRVNKGALMINYVGHGGEIGWAHEKILDNSMIESWQNAYRMPLFITATCEFSRFDDPARTSSGEYVLLKGDGGGIALYTTTRLVFAFQNAVLNKFVFRRLFAPINGTMPRLGDVYRLSKLDFINDNSRNFILLGDPALRLAYPRYDIIATEINEQPLNGLNDTIRALSKVTIAGEIRNNGTKMNDFNGIVYPVVYDKASLTKTLSNDAGSPPRTFALQKNILFKGKARVTAGSFRFSFIVPKDIAYQFGRGRLSFYAHNGKEDASGYYDELIIGGINPDALNDEKGPEIKLYMNDEKFVYGGITDENPVIYALVSDESGINTVGNGIGHDITAILDNKKEPVYVLNDFYEAELDDYTRGKVIYRLENLEEGRHELKLKVWDIHNNSSEAWTEFIVARSAQIALKHVLNYPNPFTTRTVFMFEHNQPCNTMDVTIQIFTVTGKLVKTLQQRLTCEGYRSDGISWDGKDEYGDRLGRGVYLYRLTVRNEKGATADKYEKLVLLR